MAKKIISLFLCTALVLLSFTACGSGGANERIVTPIDTEPEYLDPQIVSDKGAKNIVLNCFEGLVCYDENGDIVPAAAENYSVSDDGLVYTFDLRQDGQWKVTSAAKKIIGEDKAESFDTRVTAHDFVFALRRALQPETLCPYASSLMNIKNAKKVNSGSVSSKNLGVKASSDYTLVITLERKDSDFLSALTLPACLPCNEEFFELTKGRYGLSADNLIYNGPFYISNWAEKTAITIRRNSSFHSLGDDVSKLVKPSSVYFSFNSDQSTRGDKVKGGTYDLARLTAAQSEELSQKRGITQKSFASSVLSIIFNCKDEILSNRKIRQAMVYALDSKVFLDYFSAVSAAGVIPSSCVIGNESYRSKASAFETNPVNTKKAAELLSEGMEELELKDMELTILCSEENETIVRSAMQQWQSAFGVIFGISVEAVDSQTLKSRVEADDFELALYEVEFNDSTAECAVGSFSSSSRNNIANFSDKKYDAIISKLSITGGVGKTVSVIEEAEAYLLSCCVIMPICETQVYYGMAKGVSQIAFSKTGEAVYFQSTIRK
ncbi:MAG: peptide ABC transporter substrate-binding protein [Acutalibacteraceae bacterium]